MNEELLDIVDEKDRVERQLTRAQAHAEGALHRCVLALLVTPSNKWVLVRQASDRQDAGQFVFPMGGHVLAHEAVEDALKREVEEELGLKSFTHRFVGKTLWRRTVLGRDENHLFHFFEISSPETIVLGDEAVEHSTFDAKECVVRSVSNPDEFGASFHFGVKAWYPHLL